MDKPRRVQLSRKKGWRMPENTVKVTRPGRWGNPFKVEGERTALTAVEAFREMMGRTLTGPLGESEAHALRHYLAGKNLACWCRLCDAHKHGKPFGVQCADCSPCHSDVLLELANRPA